MKEWETIRDQGWLSDILGARKRAAHWTEKFENTFRGAIDTWDYQWIFTCWRERRVTIFLAINLVRNIGFGKDATHTIGSNTRNHSTQSQQMVFSLRHSQHMITGKRADRHMFDRYFRKVSGIRKQLSRMKRIVHLKLAK